MGLQDKGMWCELSVGVTVDLKITWVHMHHHSPFPSPCNQCLGDARRWLEQGGRVGHACMGLQDKGEWV